MTDTKYENVVKAKELLQDLNDADQDGELEGSLLLEGGNLLFEEIDTAAVAAVLMSSIFDWTNGWTMPATKEALRFYDEAERRITQGLGIPVRIDVGARIVGYYASIVFFYPDTSEWEEVPDSKAMGLGTALWEVVHRKRQDILPIISHLEEVLAVM